MKFIKTDARHYFNSDQILAFVIHETCISEGRIGFSVNIVPVNADYRKQPVPIEGFDCLSDAEDFLAELVAKLNTEAGHVEA